MLWNGSGVGMNQRTLDGQNMRAKNVILWIKTVKDTELICNAFGGARVLLRKEACTRESRATKEREGGRTHVLHAIFVRPLTMRSREDDTLFQSQRIPTANRCDRPIEGGGRGSWPFSAGP